MKSLRVFAITYTKNPYFKVVIDSAAARIENGENPFQALRAELNHAEEAVVRSPIQTVKPHKLPIKKILSSMKKTGLGAKDVIKNTKSSLANTALSAATKTVLKGAAAAAHAKKTIMVKERVEAPIPVVDES